MKKIVIIYGSIAGAILVLSLALGSTMGMGSVDYGQIIGFATMIVALSIIFPAVRSYREKELGGKITFGRAFLMGLYISLVASFFYVVGWLIIDAVSGNSLMDEYAANMLAKLQESGATQEEIAKKEEEMEFYREMYSNPFTKAAVTFMEILPVDLIMPLVSALVLKKK